MPFTFSHPAAILPLNYFHKKWLSLTALVVGSMTPDFEYFIRMKEYTMYSHTWAGIFWYDLPLAVLLAFLFHNVVRRKLILFSPYILKRRLWKYKDVDWNNRFREEWFAVITSFLIGIVSHLLLDKFTHGTVKFINKLPGLEEQEAHKGYHQVSYFLFWDINSLIGMLLVLYSIWQLPKDKKVVPGRMNYTFWVAILAFGLLVIYIRFHFFGNFSIANLVVSSISAFLASLLLASLVFKGEGANSSVAPRRPPDI